MTTNTDQTARAALDRADLVAGLRELADHLEADPGGPLPVVYANYRVHGATAEEKLARLRLVERHLGVKAAKDRMGSMVARRWFRSVCAEGHVSHPDRSVSGYLARAAAFRASQNGAAA
jgi:hypothetical protein